MSEVQDPTPDESTEAEEMVDNAITAVFETLSTMDDDIPMWAEPMKIVRAFTIEEILNLFEFIEKCRCCSWHMGNRPCNCHGKMNTPLCSHHTNCTCFKLEKCMCPCRRYLRLLRAARMLKHAGWYDDT